jgi:parallel beta-helix repeat protein
VRIYGNLIEDAGLGGIGFYGNPYIRKYNNKNNIISNNYIKDIGIYFGALSGIHLFFSGDNLISNNEITQAPFNGIELRGMRYDELKITSKLKKLVSPNGDITSAEKLRDIIYTKNNIIENNEISYVLKGGNDNGGIYTSGVVSNILDNNKIHDITPNPSGFAAGIYLDPNSDFTTVKNNIIFNIKGIGRQFSGLHVARCLKQKVHPRFSQIRILL